MKHNFDKSLNLVLKHEGGYVNHPKDPGGPTNKGITQRTYNHYRISKGLEIRSVSSILGSEIRDIYKKLYWDKSSCDSLPSGVDYAVFDFSVNSGVGRSIRFLQDILGVKMDGIAGNDTILFSKQSNAINLIGELCIKRLNWMKTLRTFSTFGKGWTRRVMGSHNGYQKTDYGVIDYAINMALENDKNSQKKIEKLPSPVEIGNIEDEVQTAKALDSDQLVLKTPVGAVSASAALISTVMVADQSIDIIKGNYNYIYLFFSIIILFLTLFILLNQKKSIEKNSKNKELKK